MKNFIPFVLCLLLLLSGCGSVPLTGRSQLLLVSDSEVMASSLSQYSEFMKSAKTSTDRPKTDMVVRVGRKIAAATESYLKANGLEAEIKNFAWEFNLVKSGDVNAFCMPGGKIVVYEGIMPYATTDEELAAVLGHEVAHAVAKHSNERMSQQVLAGVGETVVNEALSKKSAIVKTAAGTVYGLGTQYGVMLPFSRKHEYEADHMGLIFMAMAGYNPQAAVTFWTRMAQAKSGSTPEFMSTHPSDGNRIAEIQKYMPEALKYYKK